MASRRIWKFAVFLLLSVSASAAMAASTCTGLSTCWLDASANLRLNASKSVLVGAVSFKMQPDGNFVAYRGSSPVWASSMMPQFNVGGFSGPTYGLSCASCYAVFQTDGNLVLYNPAFQGTAGHAYWASGTSGHSDAILRFADSAPYLEITNYDGKYLWSTSGQSSGSFVASLNQADPMSWLTKSVCQDSSGVALKVDPYGGCPSGSKIRKIKIGESLPYYNQDSFNSQWNNFPVRSAEGKTYVVNARQFEFAGTYDHRFRSSDQYDVYAVNIDNDGWVSAPNTRDGGGYNTTFFGPNCEVGGGWRMFPATNFLAGGTTNLTIYGKYWQQSGEAFPGTCTNVPTSTAFTKWEFLQKYTYGGFNSAPLRKMDTIRTIHGYWDHPYFFQNGHLEIYYFTREFGLTRWEVWTPVENSIPPVKDTWSCGVLPDKVSYQGHDFVITDCRDNSAAVPATASLVPIWPIPNVNMLSHANFDNAGGYLPASDPSLNLWHRAGVSSVGNIINWSLLFSTTAADKGYGGVGVSYLATNCAAGSGICGYQMSPPVYQEIYQELPASRFVSGGSYAYGVSARVRPGSGTSGQMMVGIQVLDAAGNVLWGDSFIQTMTNDDGSFPGNLRDIASVFKSSGFYSKRVNIPISTSAYRVRYFISPLTRETFDVLETWFAPW